MNRSSFVEIYRITRIFSKIRFAVQTAPLGQQDIFAGGAAVALKHIDFEIWIFCIVPSRLRVSQFLRGLGLCLCLAARLARGVEEFPLGGQGNDVVLTRKRRSGLNCACVILGLVYVPGFVLPACKGIIPLVAKDQIVLVLSAFGNGKVQIFLYGCLVLSKLFI